MDQIQYYFNGFEEIRLYHQWIVQRGGDFLNALLLSLLTISCKIVITRGLISENHRQADSSEIEPGSSST